MSLLHLSQGVGSLVLLEAWQKKKKKHMRLRRWWWGLKNRNGGTKTITGCKGGINLKGAERVWKW